MEFIKIAKDRYMIKDSNNYIVDEKEKLQLEKKQLVLKDISSNECQSKTTKKIKKINKEIENARSEIIEETTESTE